MLSWEPRAAVADGCVRLVTPPHVTLRVIDKCGDQVLSAQPWCLGAVDVPEGRQVRLVSDQLTLPVGERRTRASVSAFGELESVVCPGWGDGVVSQGGGDSHGWAAAVSTVFLTSEQDLQPSAWAGPASCALSAALGRGLRSFDLRFRFMHDGRAAARMFS